MAKSPYYRNWRKRRAEQLQLHPLCAYCLNLKGRVTAATVADHVVPHRQDRVLFEGPLQSLCASCHSGIKAELEQSGRMRGSDLQGNPIDRTHPWYRK